MLLRPVGAHAVPINSAGPLSAIYVDEDLGCQVQAAGDVGPTFFGGTEPGACGTFLSLTNAPGIKEANAHHVFGPSPPGGVVPEAEYKALKQKLSGAGTEKSPFVITTTVAAFEPGEVGEREVAKIVETDTYVVGQDSYKTAITVESGPFLLAGTLYHVGDCSLSGLATGFGAGGVPTAGSVACTIQPGNGPSARFMAFTPTTAGFGLMEDQAKTVWASVNAGATQFPDTVAAATQQDNGMGISWPFSLSREEPEQTFTLTTTVSPTSPPTSSSSAGACSPSGQVPVKVSAINGPLAVRYTIDGGAQASAPTDAAGNATINVGAGLHTLEYRGEDETKAQEAVHHVVAVGGAPTLAITSDQGKVGYVLGEKGSVTVAAAGGALTSNPSASGVPISTASLGTFSVVGSATNACGTTNASFTYTVLPPPVLGESVNVEPVSGKVFVALPPGAQSSSLTAPLAEALVSLHKGLRFIPLPEARQIPVGSTLKATAGVARITTATATKGQLQFGSFSAGIFKLLQARRQRGLAQLNLIDSRNASQVCASTGKARVAATHLSSKVLGRLTGSAHGKFTTRGKYSAATVRGTIWSVTNQCNGTITRVTRGVVKVRDFLRRKTITLRAAKHYLARAPG